MRIIMNKIASFTVNHLDLLTGVYVSRKDYQGDVVLTTFDLRFTRPNVEAPMDTAGIHSIEHLMATFLRNNKEWADKTIYFGHMRAKYRDIHHAIAVTILTTTLHLPRYI